MRASLLVSAGALAQTSPRRRRAPVALTAALLWTVAAAACGSGTPAASPSPPGTSAAPPPTATPSPSPTPAPPPDNLAVTVQTTGLGVYLETTVPVAVVHNAATGHAAVNVTVSFTVLSATQQPLASTTAELSRLAPGQTASAAGRAALSGGNHHLYVAVSVGSWAPTPPGPPPLQAGPATYRCGSCGASGYGTATASIHAAGTPPATLTATAVCHRSGGGIVGGGSTLVTWPGQGGSVAVPVIVSAPPVDCSVDAVPGGF